MCLGILFGDTQPLKVKETLPQNYQPDVWGIPIHLSHAAVGVHYW